MRAEGKYVSTTCNNKLHLNYVLTLYQPMTRICVMSVLLFFHKSIRIYMEVIILGANTLYNVFCFWHFYLNRYDQVWLGKGYMLIVKVVGRISFTQHFLN